MTPVWLQFNLEQKKSNYLVGRFNLIPMGTICALLLADLFLYSYEADFIQQLKKNWVTRLKSSFNFTYRYIDDVLLINNSNFGNYTNVMYPEELEIKDTTDTTNLDVQL